MKTKYRIKQIGFNYYPQERILGIWTYLNIPTCNISYGAVTLGRTKTICCSTLANAKYAITNYDNNYLEDFKCRGHKVKTFYEEREGKYYYIDVTSTRTRSTPLYSTCSEALCEQIAENEDERIKKEKANKKVTIHEFTED